MRERRAADGGFYLPYRVPKLSHEELRGLQGMTSAERVLFVARRFLRLPEKLFDADGAIIRVSALSSRTAVCEIFPQKSGSFRGFADEIAKRVCPDGLGDALWLALSIRIGAVAAAVAEYRPNTCVDISMVSGDLFGPMCAYLAREIGLPVGDILCCCNENSGFWELLHHGELRTDQTAARSVVPEADVAVPDGLECLIALCCGREEVVRYLDAVRSGKTYVPGEEGLDRLRASFRATVVTGPGLLRGAYIPCGAPVKACTALALTGLLDYRAATGSGRSALVIAE